MAAPISGSIANRLRLLALAVAFPPLLLLGVAGFDQYYSTLEAARRSALGITDAVSVTVTNFFEVLAEQLSADAFALSTYYLSGSDLESCSTDLEQIQLKYAYASGLAVVDSQGDVLCDYPAGSLPARVTPLSQMGPTPVEGRLQTGPVSQLVTGGSWLLPVAVPLLETVTREGLTLQVWLNLDAVSERLLPEAEYLSLVTVASPNSVVVFRSQDRERIGSHVPVQNRRGTVEIQPGRSVTAGPDLTGTQRYWGQVSTPTGWSVYTGITQYQAFGALAERGYVAFFLSLLIVLIVVVATAMGYRRLTQMLEREVRLVEADVGDWAELQEKRNIPSELAPLMKVLGGMVQAKDVARLVEMRGRERFEQILASVEFGVAVISLDGKLVYANEYTRSLFQLGDSDVLDVEEFYHDASERAEVLKELELTGKVKPRDLKLGRPGEAPVLIRMSSAMMPVDGVGPCMHSVLMDVTGWRRAEEALRQSQKMEAIGHLAGGIAHDFNNVLMTVLGNAEILKESFEPGSPHQAQVKLILDAADGARSVTRRLLRFSRPGAGDVSRSDVVQVVRNTTDMMRSGLPSHIQIVLDLSAEPCYADLDPREFAQALVNLILNARDAMEERGEINIFCGVEPSEVDPSRTEVVVRVTDEGVGIDSENLKQVFDPFFTTKPLGEGTGLGLSSVYTLLQQAGGTVDITSEVGRGTTVIARVPESAGGLVSDTPDRLAPNPDSPAVIVVVDDTAMVLKSVSSMLTRSGYEVHAAGSADAAVEIFRSLNYEVDLLLTDVVMPGMDGWELASVIGEAAPHIPVLFMSGFVQDPTMNAQFLEKPGLVIEKPFVRETLLDRVTSLITEARSARD